MRVFRFCPSRSRTASTSLLWAACLVQLCVISVLLLRQQQQAGRGCLKPLGSAIVPESAGRPSPTVYFITPTYTRPTQKADLIRVCHVLRLAGDVVWIVIEDAPVKSQLVARLLDECGVSFVHSAVETPDHLRRKICTRVDRAHGCYHVGELEQPWAHHRGTAQRNEGLAAVRRLQPNNGVVYFGDDDNTYSTELFHYIRATRRVSTWRVGLVGDMKYEGPVVDQDGKITSWRVGWRPDRPFPVDMAGFAVHVREILDRPALQFNDDVERGMVESAFLGQIIESGRDMEALGMHLDHVFVWHTQTKPVRLKFEERTRGQNPISDRDIEV